MRVLKLTPWQIAINMNDEELYKQVERLISPKLKNQGFKVDGVGRISGEWTIMLKRGFDAEEKDV